MLDEFVYQLKIPPITDFISNIDQYKIKKKVPLNILQIY